MGNHFVHQFLDWGGSVLHQSNVALDSRRSYALRVPSPRDRAEISVGEVLWDFPAIHSTEAITRQECTVSLEIFQQYYERDTSP
jgi:hypothetical protein